MIIVEIKKLLKGLFIWSTIIGLLLILFISMFPSMSTSEMQQLIGVKMDAIPEGLLKALNLTVMPDFTDLNQYFAYCAQFIAMAACVYAGLLSSASLIKEETEGTIEFLYSKPVSRTQIVTSKLLATQIIFILFNIVIYVISVIACTIVAPDNYNFVFPLFKIIASFYLIGTVYYAIGFALSSVLPSVHQATPAALGIFFTTYLLGVFSGIIDKVKWLKYIAPFNYILPNEVIKSNYSLDIVYIIIIIAIILLSVSFTYWNYNKKDMRI